MKILKLIGCFLFLILSCTVYSQVTFKDDCKNCDGIDAQQGNCYIPNSEPRESWANITRDYTGSPFQSSPIGGTVDGLIRTQLSSCGGGADWSGNWYDETTGGGGQYNGGSINGLGIAYGDQSKDANGRKCQTICVSACTIIEEFIVSVNDTDSSINECVEVETGSYDVIRFGTSQSDWTLTTLPNGNEFWCPNIENTFISFVIEDNPNFCFKWTQHDNPTGGGSTSFFQAVYHDKVQRIVNTCDSTEYYLGLEDIQITELPEGSICEDLECHGLPSPERCDSSLVYFIDYPTNGVNFIEWENDPHDNPSNIWTGLPKPSNGLPSHISSTITNQGVTPDWNHSTSANNIEMWSWIDTRGLGDIVLRDVNTNTGERLFPFVGSCCGNPLALEELTVNTQTSDRGYGLFDDSGGLIILEEGIHFIGWLASDLSANQGVDIEFTNDLTGVSGWSNFISGRSYTSKPTLECKRVGCDYVLLEGESYTKIELCDIILPSIIPSSGDSNTDDQQLSISGDVISLEDGGSVTIVHPTIPNQEICTGGFIDVTGRSGWLHTWSPIYTANSGTVLDGYNQVSTAEVSPNCVTDITVNVALGNSYVQLRNMWGRIWYDVRLLINGTAVTTWTFQAYHYEDDRRSTASLVDNDIIPLGSAHFARSNVPAGATITVEIQRRHNFVAGPAAGSTPRGRVISGLRSHFNVSYSPTQIVTDRQ